MLFNRERPDAKDILDHGIRLALQATGYTANAKVFRELAVCLPYLSDIQPVSYYTDIIDGQRGELERIGPSEDFIRLQLMMARAEWKHDRTIARAPFVETYYAIGRITDLGAKTAATARLAAALARTDKERELEREDGLHSLVDEELNEGVDSLLAGSSGHFEACRGVVQALAIACPAAALQVVRKFNTEYRRDLGYSEFVESTLGGPLSETNPTEALAALSSIVDPEVRDAAIEEIVDRIRRGKLSLADAGRLRELVMSVETMYTTSSRALRCTQVIGVLESLEEATSEKGRLEGDLLSLRETARAAWDALDDNWKKLEIGYEVVVALALSAPDLAKDYVDDANRLKRQLQIGDSETALAATMGLRLAIRAYGGLAAKNLVAVALRERLVGMIGRVGSISDQCQLLAELAVRSYLAGRRRSRVNGTESAGSSYLLSI